MVLDAMFTMFAHKTYYGLITYMEIIELGKHLPFDTFADQLVNCYIHRYNLYAKK